MAAADIVSIFALIFWSFQLFPQAYLNYKSSSTDGLSPFLLLSWSLGSVFTESTILLQNFLLFSLFNPISFLFLVLRVMFNANIMPKRNYYLYFFMVLSPHSLSLQLNSVFLLFSFILKFLHIYGK